MHSSGVDYSYVCTKPCKESDRQETIDNYVPETFSQREVLLNDLPRKFKVIDQGLLNFILMCIEWGGDPAKSVERGLDLLKEAHNRPSHIESVILARLKEVLESGDNQTNPVLIDVLMCPSGSSFYCDDSPTMDILRPYMTGVRKGIL